jgi:enoyl-CoA hydratase/carnithine racemase
MSEVLSSVDSGILQLTINRPGQRNALNLGVLEGLRIFFREAGIQGLRLGGFEGV